MKASRSEDDNNETKEKFDVMIAEQELLVDGLSNRGHAKGVPQTGKHAAGKKRRPHTGKAKKGPTNFRYLDIAWRPECETDGCTALKRSNGRTLAGTQSWRKTC